MQVEDVPQHREQVLLDAADHSAVDEGRRRRVAQLQLHAPGLAHDADVEVCIALEDRPSVVGLAAAVQDRERAAPIERVESAARGIEQAVDLVLREILKRAGRCDPRIDGVDLLEGRYDRFGPAHHGRMSIGSPTLVRNQMSTMSELLTAMQPSVQSLRV